MLSSWPTKTSRIAKHVAARSVLSALCLRFGPPVLAFDLPGHFAGGSRGSADGSALLRTNLVSAFIRSIQSGWPTLASGDSLKVRVVGRSCRRR